jgi:two-component system NarL family response regulator
VLVVEDNFYTRLGTVAFLERQVDIEVVGQVADGRAALAAFAELRPDVVVVDLRMPGMDGVQVVAALIARDSDARMLVLTHYVGEEDVFQALKAGARGYLTKESSGDELLAALRAVHAGERFLPSEILACISNRENLPELTRREQQVLIEIADGASNRETAAALGISERTVGVYVSSILSKLGARSRTEAISLAARRGLLPARRL